MWRLDPQFDILLPVHKLASLPHTVQDTIRFYGYVIREIVENREQEVYVIPGDNARHMNHDPVQANITDAVRAWHSEHGELPSQSRSRGIHVPPSAEDLYLCVASRDIQPWEEILCNYEEFDLAIEQKFASA